MIEAGEISIEARVLNWGAVKSEATDLTLAINDEPKWNESNLWAETVEVPEIDPRSRVGWDLTFTLSSFVPGQDYYMIMQVEETASEHPGRSYTNRDYKGFSLDLSGQLVVRCQGPGPGPGGSAARAGDPFTGMQWHLANTGQRAFARNGGVPGEDLGMSEALAAGDAGRGVRIAVADTGLEICHPDLAANVEPGASYNFNLSEWSGTLAGDPFNHSSVGDHGTSVAGAAAAVHRNGLGGRGVAAEARLRGYNLLEAIDWPRAWMDSLGASGMNPNSSEVDIFNMSFGGLGYVGNPHPDIEIALFRNGVTNLRGGRGAIYVKSAGNGFGSCRSIPRSVNDLIGCNAANRDPTNNMPYPHRGRRLQRFGRAGELRLRRLQSLAHRAWRGSPDTIIPPSSPPTRWGTTAVTTYSFPEAFPWTKPPMSTGITSVPSTAPRPRRPTPPGPSPCCWRGIRG